MRTRSVVAAFAALIVSITLLPGCSSSGSHSLGARSCWGTLPRADALAALAAGGTYRAREADDSKSFGRPYIDCVIAPKGAGEFPTNLLSVVVQSGTSPEPTPDNFPAGTQVKDVPIPVSTAGMAMNARAWVRVPQCAYPADEDDPRFVTVMLPNYRTGATQLALARAAVDVANNLSRNAHCSDRLTVPDSLAPTPSPVPFSTGTVCGLGSQAQLGISGDPTWTSVTTPGQPTGVSHCDVIDGNGTYQYSFSVVRDPVIADAIQNPDATDHPPIPGWRTNLDFGARTSDIRFTCHGVMNYYEISLVNGSDVIGLLEKFALAQAAKDGCEPLTT